MRLSHLVLIFLLSGLPWSATAEISPNNVPSGAFWYFHADFAAMQSGEAGNQLYMWIDDEVFDEVREDTGVDIRLPEAETSSQQPMGAHEIAIDREGYYS